MNLIFNTDETSLNYKMLPSKTLAVKTDRGAHMAKKCKGYVTVLTYTNASSSFRLSLLIFGKSAKPRAWKNYDFQKHHQLCIKIKRVPEWRDSAFSKLVFRRIYVTC